MKLNEPTPENNSDAPVFAEKTPALGQAWSRARIAVVVTLHCAVLLYFGYCLHEDDLKDGSICIPVGMLFALVAGLVLQPRPVWKHMLMLVFTAAGLLAVGLLRSQALDEQFPEVLLLIAMIAAGQALLLWVLMLIIRTFGRRRIPIRIWQIMLLTLLVGLLLSVAKYVIFQVLLQGPDDLPELIQAILVMGTAIVLLSLLLPWMQRHWQRGAWTLPLCLLLSHEPLYGRARYMYLVGLIPSIAAPLLIALSLRSLWGNSSDET